MKNQYAVANALALTTAIVFALCRLLVGIFPDQAFAIAQSWFHGIGFSQMSVANLTMSSFVSGLISSAITAWIVGLIFAKVYKLFVK